MATKKRLIDANAVLAKQFTAGLSDASGNYYGHADVVFVNDIENAPNVDAVEVVHGRWIERPLDNFRKYEVKCSECGFIGIGNYDQYLEPIDFNYCPNCGAKMDGAGERKDNGKG